MNRREFLRYVGATTLDAIVSTSILYSVGCDSKENYSGYNQNSDEAEIIRKVRKIMKELIEKKKEPPYYRHDDEQKHLLVFEDNYLVEIYPPGTRVDDFGIFKSKGRAAMAYMVCRDECEHLKNLSKRINRPDVLPFPDYRLAKILFLEDEQGKDWEPVSFKHHSESFLNAGGKSILNKLRGKK